MAFRQVGVFEIREILRLWLRRSIQRLSFVNRKTVYRYVDGRVVMWAGGLGVARSGGQ